MTPLISICIPAYKRAAFIKRLLDSIAIQSFQDYEVVITDDSPGDDVEQVYIDDLGSHFMLYSGHGQTG